MAEHTKGRLTHDDSRLHLQLIRDESGRLTARVIGGDVVETIANARRLVAAWNACEGITTEALEAGVIDVSELPNWTKDSPVA